jgi:hypothetical protein
MTKQVDIEIDIQMVALTDILTDVQVTNFEMCRHKNRHEQIERGVQFNRQTEK